jgi:DNA-binding Lrp family transcriptional regulator
MEDGLARPAEIKRRLGVPESCIRKRIKEMRDRRSITFEVVPNKEVLEDEAWATIGINTESAFNDKMLDIIVSDPNVYLVSVCLGRFDLVIAARFKNIDLLTGFVSTKLASIPGINSVQTFLHSKPIKYHNTRLSKTSTATLVNT